MFVCFVCSPPLCLLRGPCYWCVTCVYPRPPQCMVGQWSSAPVVCEPTCPTVNLPNNAGTCVKQLFNGTFGTGTSTASLAYFEMDPPVPAVQEANFFQLVNSE